MDIQSLSLVLLGNHKCMFVSKMGESLIVDTDEVEAADLDAIVAAMGHRAEMCMVADFRKLGYTPMSIYEELRACSIPVGKDKMAVNGGDFERIVLKHGGKVGWVRNGSIHWEPLCKT